MGDVKIDPKWRKEVLAGTDPDSRDTPAVRADAAEAFYAGALKHAAARVNAAKEKIEKVKADYERDLAGAEDHLEDAQAELEQAKKHAAMSEALADELRAEYGYDGSLGTAAGPATDAKARPAEGKG